VNMDPANAHLPYAVDLDVRELVSLDETMQEHGLGPNGGLLFCMESIECNFEWLARRLREFEPDSYFVFDFPGQVELFTNHTAVQSLIKRLEARLQFRLVVVHLADSTHCREPRRYVSLALLTLQSMLRLECAQINVMSKFDLFDSHIGTNEEAEEDLPLSYYADCEDLSLLLDRLNKDQVSQKYASLNTAVTGLIDEFGLVSFIPVAVEDKECMAYVLQEADKANGLVFGGLTEGNESIHQAAMTFTDRDKYLASMQRKYMHAKTE
jgi:GTPase SAR1 family protein